ncbi:MAG: long-chain-fatty-acid--CoA ligase [bacterium]
MDTIKGFPSTSMDDYQLNMINIIKQATNSFANQQIVSRKMDGTIFRYTYKDAYERIQRLANAIIDLGLSIGDRIGVLEWNTYRFYEMDFGIPGIGAVLVQLNPRLSTQELSYVINHSGIKFIFVNETLLPIIEAAAPLCNKIEGYVVLTDQKFDKTRTKLSPIYNYEEIVMNAKPEHAWLNLDEKSAYAACYTTATTGRPKGVYYSHRDVYLHSMAIAINAELSYRDAFFQITPMFHANGWGTPQAATLVGAKLVFPGRYSIDNIAPLVELMVQEKITVGDGAPAIFMPMLEYIKQMKEKPNLKGARLLSGATEPPVAMMKGFYELTGAEIIHAYGATETTPLVTINRLKPWLTEKLTEEEKWELRKKQGYTVVGLDLKIVDASDREVPHDGKTIGEILIRGPWITGKYYNAPETEELFSKDGYWRSGDAGTIDEEGYIKITDRIKDLIKSGGEWISSIDMENELVSHPAILEAAVTGVKHPKWEEKPIVLIVLRNEYKGKVNKDDIIEYLRKSGKFAKWQLPEIILFVDQIPKTSVGKINKKAIREEYKDIFTGQGRNG